MKKSSQNRDLILIFILGLALVVTLTSSILFWRARASQVANVPARVTKSILPDGSASELSLYLGVRLAKQRQFDMAKKIFEELLVKNPNDASVLNNMAFVVGEQGNASQASEYLRNAIQIAPKCGECLNNLGSILYQQGKTDEAKDMFMRAALVAPDLLDVKLNLAVLFEEQGDWAQALEWYSKAESQVTNPELKKWVAMRSRWMSEISKISSTQQRQIANEKK